MMDATYTYTGDYNKVGNTNALKDFLVKKGGETGEILFGDEKLGEKMGSWAYTGLDVVSFLNGVDKLGKSFGKLQTITSGTAETSKVWGEIHMDDVIDNDLKYLSKDGIIKTILHIDPNSVANFGYDVVTGTIKSIKSAGHWLIYTYDRKKKVFVLAKALEVQDTSEIWANEEKNREAMFNLFGLEFPETSKPEQDDNTDDLPFGE